MSAQANVNINVNTGDSVGELGQLETSLEQQEQKLAAFQGGIDVIGGSVESLVGGLALLGIENEYIENLEQGALGAIAFADGIKRFGDGVVTLSKNTKIATVAQRVFNVVANANPYLLAATVLISVGAAIYGLAQALKQTALESALANQSASELADTLIANKEAADDLELSTENLVEVFTQAADASQRQLDNLNNSDELLKAQGLSEEEILGLKMAQTDEVIAYRKQAIDALKEQKEEEIAKTQRYAEITSGILQFMTSPIQVLLAAVDGIITGLNMVGAISDETYENIGSLRDGFNESVVGLIFDPKQTEEEADATIQEAEDGLLKLENQRAGYQNRMTAIDKKASDDRIKIQQEAARKQQEIARQQQQIANDEIAKEEELSELAYQASLTERERELLALNDYYFEKITLAEQYGIDSTALVEEQRRKTAEINKKFDDQELQALAEREAADIAFYNSKIDLALQAGAVLGQLSQLAEEGSDAAKALALTEIGVNTAVGFIQGLNIAQKTALTSPAPGLVFPIFYASQIASVLAAAGKAKQVLASSTGGGGGGGGFNGGGLNAPAPQLPNITAPDGLDREAAFFASQNNEPIQAYVLASDVNDGLEARQRIQSRRTL